MRAVVHDRYRSPDVLRPEDVEPPVPGDGDVLVRIHATTVNQTDFADTFGDRPFIWHVATPTGVSSSSANSTPSGGLYGS